MNIDGKLVGKYKAWCRDIHDPEMLGRIRVECPPVYGKDWSDWAMPCLPPGMFFIPKEGQGVWIEFEEGNPDYPIWCGTWFSGSNSTTSAPHQSKHMEPWTHPKTGAMIDKDKKDHEANPIDNFEHKKFGEHPPYYEPHIFSLNTHRGGYIAFSEEPGKEFVEIKTPRLMKYDDKVAVIRMDNNGIVVRHPAQGMEIQLPTGKFLNVIDKDD